MIRKKTLEQWETKLENTELTLRQYGLLRSPSLTGMDQGHQLLFLVF
jgi:hypothetical protein